jgi:two-component system sensor histidine kinase DctS
MALALVFVAAVLGWAAADEARERETERQTLIADALSTAQQLRTRLEAERARLAQLAVDLTAPHATDLASEPGLRAGLDGLWQSVTRLDAQHQTVDHQPPRGPTRGDGALSLHLAVPLPEGGGSLVLRYDPERLLQRGVPWWLARRYDVQLVDSADQVVASLVNAPVRVGASGLRPSHRVQLDEALAPDVVLELTLRDPAGSSLRPLAGVLIAGFVPLSVCCAASCCSCNALKPRGAPRPPGARPSRTRPWWACARGMPTAACSASTAPFARSSAGRPTSCWAAHPPCPTGPQMPSTR